MSILGYEQFNTDEGKPTLLIYGCVLPILNKGFLHFCCPAVKDVFISRVPIVNNLLLDFSDLLSLCTVHF